MRSCSSNIVQALLSDGDNASIHAAHVVENWYEKLESELQHIEWPTHIELRLGATS